MLNLILDGKFGPGIYEDVRRGVFMSMEKGFEEEIKKYADVLSQKIKGYLLTQMP